ncbi:MAG: hypothetical protein BLM47_09595 [Candidatus Reconcilbacillus cellulovorans]|uniref:L,D-TPase catalytic domain-containing protein n=1 Tax=Candidatus Reconcilbacillus cellulovorans TaxID=1906605 RepID=A0A2A6DZ01_9BACL|nr:MAG: hypothetical protein BLM47_09595 [Candidatus Reconcilbacillus cellulovorans]
MLIVLVGVLALAPTFALPSAAPMKANVVSAAHAVTAPSTKKKAEFRLEVDPYRNRMTVYRCGKVFRIYPIAAGKPDTPSPVGDWVVVHKAKDWGGGFGTRWLGLNVPWGVYGIHGTNRPASIGRDASAGCIRMFNRHVEELYEWIPVGTAVTIVGHPLGEPYRDPRDLARGDSGADVYLIQSRLRSAGYFYGNPNGKFGPATEEALRHFERTHGLPVEGVMNRHDYTAMGLLE